MTTLFLRLWLVAALTIVLFDVCDARERHRGGIVRWVRRNGCSAKLSSRVVVLQSHPRIVGVRTDWLRPDGKWEAVPEDEVAWADEVNRYVCLLEPNDFSDVRLIRFIKRPWDDPNAPWIEFARAEKGVSWAQGALGVGNWAVSVEVHFSDGNIRRLHDPAP